MEPEPFEQAFERVRGHIDSLAFALPRHLAKELADIEDDRGDVDLVLPFFESSLGWLASVVVSDYLDRRNAQPSEHLDEVARRFAGRNISSGMYTAVLAAALRDQDTCPIACPTKDALPESARFSRFVDVLLNRVVAVCDTRIKAGLMLETELAGGTVGKIGWPQALNQIVKLRNAFHHPDHLQGFPLPHAKSLSRSILFCAVVEVLDIPALASVSLATATADRRLHVQRLGAGIFLPEIRGLSLDAGTQLVAISPTQSERRPRVVPYVKVVKGVFPPPTPGSPPAPQSGASDPVERTDEIAVREPLPPAEGDAPDERASIDWVTFAPTPFEYRQDDGCLETLSITSPFRIARYPVTVAEYARELGLPAPEPEDGQRPKVLVTWSDAVQFCNHLSDAHGLPRVYDLVGDRGYSVAAHRPGFRLPMEHEWVYCWRREIESSDEGAAWAGAWYSTFDTLRTSPEPVGQKPPNAAGLFDMAGNVWEWCNDVWVSPFPATPSPNLVIEAARAASRSVRGGSFMDTKAAVGLRIRSHRHGEVIDRAIGFRLAQTVS